MYKLCGLCHFITVGVLGPQAVTAYLGPAGWGACRVQLSPRPASKCFISGPHDNANQQCRASCVPLPTLGHVRVQEMSACAFPTPAVLQDQGDGSEGPAVSKQACPGLPRQAGKGSLHKGLQAMWADGSSSCEGPTRLKYVCGCHRTDQGRGVCNSAHVGPIPMTNWRKWSFGPSRAFLFTTNITRGCNLLLEYANLLAGPPFLSQHCGAPNRAGTAPHAPAGLPGAN